MVYKIISLSILCCICLTTNAQTGIGTISPHSSAKLDVSATNKGFLPPRVTLTSSTDVSTIPSPAEGLFVYNLGSVGLQAGYYYWNGANWATIATGGTAGNAVVASDLVKLYQEAYSTASGKASSSDGFSFTVPASGRYEFNFNCTGWNTNGQKVKLTFNIRQGTSVVLASDYHESTSSNVWAEYDGRLEVNLSAGVTYNAQVVTSTGNRDTRDWDKIMYKMVSGNLPINQFNLGDIKTGIQSSDHNGWVKLDGRLKSSLTSSQQLQATALGIGNNIPNASNAFLVQNGTTLGSLSSSNTKTIAQANLPNVTIGGSTSADGSHTHTINVNNNQVVLVSDGNVTSMAEGNSNWSPGAVARSASVLSSSGNHSHTLTTNSINGNVAQTQLDITPRSLSVNTFLYLGL